MLNTGWVRWSVGCAVAGLLGCASASRAADDRPQVLLKTTQGDVVIELYEDEAPNTVANFVHLVETKFYNGLKFHRVIEGFVAQGGDPQGDGTGGPGYTIACECRAPGALKHSVGCLSMAHAGPDTGGSQFFITLGPTPWLDGKHTVFGQVIEGMSAVKKLRQTEGGGAADKIIEAKVLKKRDHAYVPKTTPAKR